MKLSEIHYVARDRSNEQRASEHEGYKLKQHEEQEYDGEGVPENSKVWHNITPPGGKEHTLDHTPYEYIDQPTLRHYVNFHKKHGRFPDRKDIKSIGPLDKAAVARLSKA